MQCKIEKQKLSSLSRESLSVAGQAVRYVAPRCFSILLLLHLQGVVRVAVIQDDSQPHQDDSQPQ